MSRVVADYFGFLLKNVIGWVFILGSVTVGLTLPLPGGVPLMFLIGFTLISFPGKRRMLSRVMRGTPMEVDPGAFGVLVTAISVLITMAALWFLTTHQNDLPQKLNLKLVDVLGACLIAAGVTWVVLRLGLAILNFVLRRVPRIRRFLRPRLRTWGVNLLPPRRRGSTLPVPATVAVSTRDDIVELNDGYKTRLRMLWAQWGNWVRRIAGIGVTLWIFERILAPVVRNWSDPLVQAKLHQIDPISFAVAVGMFAMFLLVFRATVWLRIVAAFGYRLPVAAGVRIWSTSELARYMPGAVFQVVGRVMLAKPYGLRGSVTSVTQVLELTIFLLANVLLAVSCLLYFGIKNFTGPARHWLIAAAFLVPVLLLLLNPAICYRIINRVMEKLHKPLIEQRLSGTALLGVLIWNMLGLLWQSAAVYVLTREPLGLKADWWWVLAGAYSLAWCAGFLAFWAPGGLGVRELVFVTAMMVILPRDVRNQFSGSEAALASFLGFLSVLLRLWATAGEFLLAGVAYTLDFRGALGRADAPGRVAAPTEHAPAA